MLIPNIINWATHIDDNQRHNSYSQRRMSKRRRRQVLQHQQSYVY